MNTQIMDPLQVVQKKVLEDFHKHLYSMGPSIEFKVQMEANGQIPFLDILILRNDDGFTDTTVYKKPTHTGRYLKALLHLNVLSSLRTDPYNTRGKSFSVKNLRM